VSGVNSAAAAMPAPVSTSPRPAQPNPGIVSRVVEPSALRKVAFGTLALFLFATYGFLAETVANLAGSHLPLAKVIIGFTAVGLLVSGSALIRTLTSLLGRLILLYTGWLMLTVPLSIWRTGALDAFLGWIHSVLCFVIIATLIASFSQLRKSIFMMLLGVMAIILLGLVFGAYTEDRFSILNGTLNNANDLAIHLLLALPFCVFFIADRSASRLARIFAFLTALGILAMSLTTGSRTGILIMAVFAVALFVGASLANKIKLLAFGATLVVVAVVLLPSSLRARYSTLFVSKTDPDSSGVVYSADESLALRELLLQYSIQMAFQHPVFGIGMGNFAGVAEEQSDKSSESTMWKQPHNVYTQIAAETGIPGLILYLAILVVTIRTGWRVWRYTARIPELRTTHLLAGCLMLSLLAFTASNVFATSAYGFYLPIFAALILALERYGLPVNAPPRRA
jgi:putative inorganic carbon (hco3(-)) transporter